MEEYDKAVTFNQAAVGGRFRVRLPRSTGLMNVQPSSMSFWSYWPLTPKELQIATGMLETISTSCSTDGEGW